MVSGEQKARCRAGKDQRRFYTLMPVGGFYQRESRPAFDLPGRFCDFRAFFINFFLRKHGIFGHWHVLCFVRQRRCLKKKSGSGRAEGRNPRGVCLLVFSDRNLRIEPEARFLSAGPAMPR